MKVILTILSCAVCIQLSSQEYENYIGAGNTDGVTITSSGSADYDPMNTIDGSGLDAKKMEAARFLSQAGFGGNLADVDEVLDLGFEGWMDAQYALPASNYTDEMNAIWDEIYNGYISAGYTEDDIFGPWATTFSYTWWTHLATGDDMMRQRMAFALSQILVISIQSDLRDDAESLTTYYDLLMEHAFGNYKDLLLDVATNISMGFYLSHLNNPKADPANNIHPDENFARELMQLFTIGLYELGIDGQPLEDANGDWIPTYDNNDIKELAKVFTGLGPGAVNENVDWTDTPYFGLGIWGADMTVPMMMFEEWHEPSEKVLLGGAYTIPANQPGMEDIEEAVDFLFNHANMGPFLSRRLIQRLVTSNPSPAYIQRVAQVFNDNGSGERGDLFAVLKAILLDSEARDCAYQTDADAGKLKEPVLMLAQIFRSLPIMTSQGNYWYNGYDLLDDVGQLALASPSVFNFFTPDYAPNGGINDNDLVGPEFQIYNSLTSIGYQNRLHGWVIWNTLTWDWEDDDVFGSNYTAIDTDAIMVTMDELGQEGFLNELDILFTHGKLSDEWREEIRLAYETLNWEPYYDARIILYLLLSHPDYMIEK